MKIILNAHDNASALDLVSMVHVANYAIQKGLAEKPGEVMAVNYGDDPRNTFGVVRTKTGVSVWPPDRTALPPPIQAGTSLGDRGEGGWARQRPPSPRR